VIKVLVIGASGYIGSVLCKELCAEATYGDCYVDMEITALDNLMFNQNSLLGCLDFNCFKFVKGDIRNWTLVKELVEKNDVIVNLAAYVGEPICKKYPQEANSVILDGMSNVLESISEQQLLIYPNTNSGYGVMKDEDICTEESPLNPVSLYGKLKVEAEEMIREESNVRAAIFRLATIFGCSLRMRVDLLVNNFVYQAWKNRALVLFEPHFKRNYVHVNDVVDAFIYMIEHRSMIKKTEVYNLGNDSLNCTKLALAEQVKEALPQTEIYISETGKDPDKRDYYVSSQKFVDTFRFKPWRAIKDNIPQLISAYEIMQGAF
jgi:nucleoside-diphosphate-sugar epimerase